MENKKPNLSSLQTSELVAMGNSLTGGKNTMPESERGQLLDRVIKELEGRKDYRTWSWEWWMFD